MPVKEPEFPNYLVGSRTLDVAHMFPGSDVVYMLSHVVSCMSQSRDPLCFVSLSS